MKCPNCGKWNRASFPVCFACGTPLPAEEKPDRREAAPQPGPEPEAPITIVYDEFGDGQTVVDAKDKLAEEMLNLHQRKQRGEQQQKALRRLAAEKGFAPTGTGVVGGSRRSRVFVEVGRSRGAYPRADEPQVDYDGYTDEPHYSRSTDELSAIAWQQRGRGAVQIPLKGNPRGRARLFGLRRFVPILLLFLVLGSGGYLAYRFWYLPSLDKQQAEAEEQVEVTASILDDMPAHTVRIPAPEGAQIYIKELRRSYIVTGGYAIFQVEDHFWYDSLEDELEPQMDVTLTPFIRTGTGEQVAMTPVNYTIQIPLSPLTLIRPDVTYVEASTPIYNIQFHVMQNSTVFINGEDYSSYVNTQNGYISYNAPIQPIGENKIHIVVRSQYYRENETTLIIYRAVQDIPLDLASTLEDRSAKPSMTINATTRAGATITLLSPYNNLDTSQLASTGAFSFDAVFNRIGNNTVIIRADYPDKNPTIVEYNVYYLPDPDHYTPKAWGLDAYGYADLLANLATRVKNTQIYVLTGPVVRVVGTKPQLVIFDSADGKGSAREVLVENQTKTTWEVGKRYRIYGDASGSYGGVPRLTARYTYKPAKPAK
ncbi:MAG: zinc ribbon domain-containing protein [Clostridiales bacterium]|nr:zinc ribbon domain-containing protein [Clostridiales bacterium]